MTPTTHPRRTPLPVAGVCPVLETPFTPDGDVDEEGFRHVVRHVVNAGVGSVMFPGFASEYHKLSESEREHLIALLFEELAGTGVNAVIAIQDHATRLAVRHARAAMEAGAAAVNILPPYFLHPSPAAVTEHIEAILEAIAPAPGIVQYAPGETGAALEIDTLGHIAARYGNLAAVKVETRPSGPFIAALAAGPEPIPSIEGYAGVLLPSAVDRGAVAVQPGCSFVEIYLTIWDHLAAGRGQQARELHARLLPYLSYWMTHVELIVAAEKLISAKRGIITSAHCRAPGRNLDDAEQRMIDRFLAEFAELLPLSQTSPASR